MHREEIFLDIMLYQDDTIAIYFGDANDQLYKDEYQTYDPALPLLEQQKFTHLRQTMSINNLLFMNQIHSNFGIAFSGEQRSLPSFKTDGDFLITQEKALGIGIMAADCLPILIHDTKTNAISAVHAGWRGTVDRIVEKTIQAMHHHYETSPADLRIYFGSAAHACCYQVGDDFLEKIAHFPFSDRLIQKRNGQLFFDNLLCNRLQLEHLGVKPQHIIATYSHCTIDNHAFFSHRRAPTLSGRQMSVIALKDN